MVKIILFIILFSLVSCYNHQIKRIHKKEIRFNNTKKMSLLKTNGVYINYINNKDLAITLILYNDNSVFLGESFCNSENKKITNLVGNSLYNNNWGVCGLWTFSNNQLFCYIDKSTFLDSETWKYEFQLSNDTLYCKGYTVFIHSKQRKKVNYDKPQSFMKNNLNVKPDSTMMFFKNELWYKKYH
jgi:hypothetical protein